MISLSRTLRFTVNEPGVAPASPNGYAGRPSMVGLGRHYELVVRCAGEVDPALGYLVDIQEVDRAARAVMLPGIEAACRTPNPDPPAVLAAQMPALNAALGGIVAAVKLRLTPTLSLEVETAMPAVALLRQKFDFAAAHRLHCADLSDAENRRLFGKCNNPHGHGHNYQFEPCIAIPLGRISDHAVEPGAQAFSLQELERLADETIIRRFDHKNLNEDTTEFRTVGGLNPSVENIAKVFYELLEPAVRTSGRGATLREITVWETDRTSATYPAV